MLGEKQLPPVYPYALFDYQPVINKIVLNDIWLVLIRVKESNFYRIML